jgi:flagellar hook assembly protein FlgD
MQIFNIKNLVVFLLVCLLFSNLESSAAGVPASTDGTVTFTVLTVTNGATYSPKNVLAIWVKDAVGNFVISRKVMAANRKQHLVKWVASSSNNSVNAITGATLPSHQTHTISWDCRDVSGNLVPDGTYEIWVEYTERNSASGGAVGPSTKIVFTKGPDVVSLTPPDETYFKNMALSYSPLNVGIGENMGIDIAFSAFPSPFSDRLNVSFELPKSDFVNVSVYDPGGKRIAELVNEVLPQGNNSFYWEGKSENGQSLKPGVYFLRIIYQGKLMIHKVIFAG